jgi:hypothetical protein
MPEVKNKSRELLEELRSVIGRVGLLDAILPPAVFLVINNTLGYVSALASALALGILIAAIRIIRKQPLSYALGGLGSVGLAVGLAWFLGRSEGYFLPGILNGGITTALAMVSLLIRKPMVAWTSYVARRWPLDWYWHERVRPAYSEVTAFWFLFFAARLYWQLVLYQGQATNHLALVNILTGWPAIILLLVISYLYGSWRLARLGGPSVDEFRNNLPQPWIGQLRGF